MLLNIILISISLSIDALGIGVSYQLKGVSISTVGKIIIGLVSTMIMWISLVTGEVLIVVLPVYVTKLLGIGILMLMGSIVIGKSLFGNNDSTCDIDGSKKIDPLEALLLGFALSADSISSGIAIVTLGLGNQFIPIMVGVMQMFFLYSGSLLVSKSKSMNKIDEKICGICSGGILIIIALLRGITLG